MKFTSIPDLKEYHKYQTVEDLNALKSSPGSSKAPPDRMDTSIDDDENSLCGSAHHSSGPEEAVFDHPSRTSSPRTSHSSGDEISEIESSDELKPRSSSPFTLPKMRSPFRNPSSIRAMQMETTPPRLSCLFPKQLHTPDTPSRQCRPPSSRSHRSAMSSPTEVSPIRKYKTEYPLVLLHVTLLPIPLSYALETLEIVLPPHIFENWKLLQEKVTDTVLERGVLLPHPKDDYGLLEERLLESLELKVPRILKCGHFHLSHEEEAGVDTYSDSGSDVDNLDICPDCGHYIRDGRLGSTGTGSKRWDIKVFAANGLMRAGAWGAVWREMERVDVEIVPWMEEDMKRELELRKEEEKSKLEKVRAEKEEGVGALDDERLKEIYGEDAQNFVDGLADDTDAAAAAASKIAPRQRLGRQPEDVPLWDLLRDYIYFAAQDRRNIIILCLSVAVFGLSIRSLSASRADSPLRDVSARSTPSPEVRYASREVHVVPTGSVLVPGSMSASTSSSPEPQPINQERNDGPSWRDSTEGVVSEMLED